LFSAKGANSLQAWGNAPGKWIYQKEALKARISPSVPSVPDIALVELKAMLEQQLAVFFLKSSRAMMLLLRLDELENSIQLTRAHGERAVAALPEKAAISGVKRFDPSRGCFLNLFHELSLRDSSRQCRDNVNVIRNTANVYKFSASVPADCGHVSMHSRPHVLIQPEVRDSWY